MTVGDLVRYHRERKKLSQAALERRSGLLRAYLSRIENGHTVPSIATLEKIARGLEMRVYQLLYNGSMTPKLKSPERETIENGSFGSKKKDVVYLQRLSRFLKKVSKKDRELLLGMLQTLANK